MDIFLPLLVICPSGLRRANIVLLPVFGPSAKQDDDPVSVFAKVNAIAGTEIDFVFHHPATNRLNVREVALCQPGNCDGNLSRGMRIQTVEPIGIGAMAGRIDVFENRD
jgi:hypothetical protein